MKNNTKNKFEEQLNKLKKEIREKILLLLQTPVPGYSTCRPAICIIRDEKLKLISNSDCKKIKVLAVLNLIGDFWIITPPTKNEGYGFYQAEKNLTAEELLTIYNIISQEKYCCDNKGKYLRAINPFWFFDESHINETTAEIIGETPEEYLNKINNNPKVKQQNQEQKWKRTLFRSRKHSNETFK